MAIGRIRPSAEPPTPGHQHRASTSVKAALIRAVLDELEDGPRSSCRQVATRPPFARRTMSTATSRPRARTSCGLLLRALREGVVFFAFVIDVWSRRLVGPQLAGHMRTDLVLNALRQVLDDHGVLASIGSVGGRLR